MKICKAGTRSFPLSKSEMAEYKAGFLLPYFYSRAIIRALELGEKAIEWLTTEH